MTYTLDVEYFIKQVKKYPVIWDTNCDDNKYRHKKLVAWDQLAKKMVPEFDSLETAERANYIRMFNNKWRNIRDSFVRMCKSVKEGKKKPYMYENHLRFLYNVYNIDGTHKNDAEDKNNCSDGEEEVLIDSCKIEVEDIESIEPTWKLFGDEAFDKKRKRIKTDHSGEYVDVGGLGPPSSSYNADAPDDDRAFFESLLPVVKNFNIDQKLELRSQVLQLVTNIRKNDKKNKKDDDDFSE